MKVLLINVTCGAGSTGRICTDLYKALKDSGHECKIAYGREKPLYVQEEDAVRIGTDFDVDFHAIMTRLTDRHGEYSKKATRRLIEWIKDYSPDIIHLHNIHGYYINIDILFGYLKKSQVPVVWTLHDCWAFTGHCAHYIIINCGRWKNFCHDCRQKKSYPASFFTDNSRNNFEHKKALFNGCNMTLVPVSDWLAGEVAQSFLKNYPVKTIHNGIDLDVFAPSKSLFKEKMGIKERKIVLGTANIWSENKGFSDFFKLKDMLPDDYKIVMAGVSEKQKDKIPEGIIALERTKDIDELVMLYCAADVYFSPSRAETFGMTLVEAAACGTPVIGYDVAAVPEVIGRDGGFVVKTGDIEAAAEKIMAICENRKPFSDAALKMAKKFDKKRMYDEYFKLYRKICPSKQGEYNRKPERRTIG